MIAALDAEHIRLCAGERLRFFWNCPDDLPEARAEDEERIRDLYVDAQETDPDDVTCSVGMTLVAFSKLRAHICRSYAAPLDWFEDTMWGEPSAGRTPRRRAELGRADAAGRELAEESVRMAGITLGLEPENCLAAFALARSLEWLGERGAAVAAYEKVLAIDPDDVAARSRLTALDAEPPPPTSGNRHPYGFYVLELTEPIGHSGAREGCLALLNNPAAVRSLADDYLRDRLTEDDPEWLKEMRLTLRTNLPGALPLAMDLREALHHTPDGRQAIDWRQVAMADPLHEPLPVGCPVRWRGELLFFGATMLS
ncbi:hypothetical protein ABZ897_54210 [Nonomuraea sp. NPDC046802]|uniref:hypothetical protein n=1 Tax=Nonomuraea sp. NPDC046802 TaxID=3154919 RepID=UPI0033FCAC15